MARTTRSPRWLIALVAAMTLTAAITITAGAQEDLTHPVIDGGPPLALETVADGMTAPNWGTASPGIDDRLIVTDQDGLLWSVDLVSGNTEVFLDVSTRLVALGVGGPGTFDERGLLGVAFHPDYTTNGLLYTYTSEPEDGPADFSTMPEGTAPNHQSVIAEWRVPSPGDPDSVVDPATRREVLRIDEPQFNHDAGALVFGPDGHFYVALGDGGQGDDQGVGHVPGGNGQDPTNVLGTVLRIDPLDSNSANGQYGIPADNP
ncbi:MAG: CHRD domain-containing protein, partial [Acidimicrobiia bacterium]|nr:CHRD domain-containing protein [Acidimicrobiia bacterium]